jgi:aryl-alcohol dehydrogenase-like predicted oxidoreductase
MKADHVFRDGDHRAYRPDGWVEAGLEKIEQMRPVIERHGLSMLQFASLWNLAHAPVKSVAPTFIQEAGEDALPVEDLLRDFAALPGENPLSAEEVEQIAHVGDNTGCMVLKGASNRHEESLRPDEWPMRADLLELAGRHGLGEQW